jgi:PAS domain S-box-containing protein
MSMQRWSPPLLLTFGAMAAAGIWVAATAQMNTADRFLPHSFCFTGNAQLIRLHVVSDVLIGLAYFSIPIALVYFIRRRRDLPFSWIFLLFGAFIVACGATHWMDVWTLWNPDYWTAGALKAVTAAASVPTAIALVALIPQALLIPSVQQLREVNAALEEQIARRSTVERELLETQRSLERRVEERTAALHDANLALERERERLRVTLASIGDAVIATDTAGRVQFINGVAQELTGWTAEEAVDRPIDEVFPIVAESDHAPQPQPTERAIAEDRIVELSSSVALVARSGRRLPIDDSAAPIRDARGRVLGAVLVFRDIERQRREARQKESLLADLQAANSLLDNLFNRAPVGLGLWDEQRRFVRLNDALAEINGLPREAHIGRTVAELLPGVDSAVDRTFQQVLDSGEPILDQIVSGTTPAQGSRLRHWRVSYYPVSVGGRTVGVGAVCDEITNELEAQTERVRLLEAERAAREAAEQANRAKDEFLASVSHELRNPLNALVGWVNVLQLPDLEPTQMRSAIDRIGRSAKALTRLIEDLLDVARASTGKLHVETQRVALDSLLSAAIDMVRPAASAKGVALSFAVEGGGHVMADPERLGQIFWNLLNNAVKFTPAGGRVELTARPSGDDVEIRVTDTGQGIEPELLPHVFERFRQGERGKSAGGLGLGLAIAKSLVELHGGRLRAESEGLGRGATFVVTLPQAPEAGAAWTGQSPATHLNLQGIDVLVVEDEPDTREAIAIALQGRGARVAVSASVPDAKAALLAAAPQVVVSDIGLGEQSGYDLVRWLRDADDDALRQLPCVALTAYAQSQDRMRALAAGFNVFLVKPIDPQELALVLASLLGRFGGGRG